MDVVGVKQVKVLYDIGMDLLTLHGKRPIKASGWVAAPREEWCALAVVLANNGTNIGVRCGHPLGIGVHGVIDVDIVGVLTPEEEKDLDAKIDSILGTHEGAKCLPAIVQSGFGHGSRHLHVLTAGPEPKRKLFKSTRTVVYTKDGKTKTGPVWQIEWIGAGGQVVLPPSIHPDTGAPYQWVKRMNKGGQLPLVTLPVRKGAGAGAGARGAGGVGAVAVHTGELMVPALDGLPIAQHWKDLIESGDSTGYASRSEALFAGMVVLCRDTNLADEYIMALLLDPGSGLGEKAREKGAGAAGWLVQQLAQVRTRVLEEARAAQVHREGQGEPGERSEGPQGEPGGPLEELHALHTLVLWGGRPAVFRERKVADELLGRYEVLSPAVLKTLYQNKQVRAGAKTVNPVDMWMSSPQRRECLEGARMVCSPAVCPEGVFNLWEGWGVPTAGKRVVLDEVSWWCDFVLEVICAGNEQHARWLHDWVADLTQDPGNPKGVALVLRSGEGTGKNTFSDVLGRITGAHFRHVTQESQLTGKFNAHFMGAVLVHANEMIWAADRRSRGSLYAMITDNVLMMERKGYDSVPMRNQCHFIISGNMDWLVPAGIDARRWFVLDVLELMKGNTGYFKALRGHITVENMSKLLRWYQDRKVTVDLRKAPVTEGLVDQKLANFDSFQVWWHEVLERGSVQMPIGDGVGPWEDDEHPITKERIHGSYLQSCKEAMVRYPLSSLRFMRKLHKQVSGLTEVRTARAEGRKRALAMPKLEELRKAAHMALRT